MTIAPRYRSMPLVTIALACSLGGALAQGVPSQSFDGLISELWPAAQAQGITRNVFDAAFATLTPDPRVAALTQRQPEYSKAVGSYIASAASKARIDAGVRKAREFAPTLARIEKTYGVDASILLGVWGIETSYGAAAVRWDVIRSLATLVDIGYRQGYFRKELLSALKILQDGHVARDKLLGSWAGAMGQPQFMPTSFYRYAVDFSGDGKRDIWSDVPDVLGSMANYLREEGWTPGVPWGFEVRLPRAFDFRLSRGSFQAWRERGLVRADGSAFPVTGDAILFFPSGARGPAFLVTENFSVIKRYNNSDVYALAVAQIADRVRGHPPIQAAWPTSDPQLPREQRIALQKSLARLGYTVRDFEGRIDFDLRDAIREQQSKFGMTPDGHPTAALLDRLAVAVR